MKLKFYLPAVLISLLIHYSSFAISETEPNGSFATANSIPQDSTITGGIGSGLDANDYFKSYPSDDGTVKVTFTCTSSASTDDFFIYAYTKTGGYLGNKYLYNLSVGTHTDSFYVYCRAQDTIYFRVSSSGTFSYSFHYNLFPTGTSDVEPNDQFADAQYFTSTDTIDGRIGYYGTTTDQNDYFVTELPIYGTLNWYITYNNTSNNTGSDLFIYVYNKAGSLIGNSYQYNQPLGISTDSITIYCREQDTVYLRINSTGCFSYQIHYEVVPPATNDTEPNDGFATAQVTQANTTVGGRIGYSSVQTDQNDYFLAILPTFGTLNLYTEYINTSNSTNSDIFIYVYNKAGSLIGNSYRYNQPLGSSFDTISIFCRELDTVYVRYSSAGCFSYNFSYEVIAPTTNDAEPNNDFASAQLLLPNDTLGGRIGYISVSTDNNDYFYSVLPDDGTIKYFIKYYNTANQATADIFTYIYNKNGNLIGSDYNYNNPVGMHIDSISVPCRAEDTVYFRISSSGCFSYKIYYEMDVPSQADDPNNDALTNAQWVSFSDTTYGRIGYTSLATDNNDYFLTTLPDDGTLKYVLAYNNTSDNSGSDFFSYIYNKAGALIGSSYQYNQAIGQHYDTIYVPCRLADSIYIRISSSGCFSYNYHLEVIPSGMADVEPNGSLQTATPVQLNNKLNGRVGYRSVAVDSDDYFKFYVPEFSNITAYLKFNNTSGSASSDIFFYLYRSNGSTAFTQYYYNQNTGEHIDTLLLSCLPSDTFYLRVNAWACFSYELDFVIETRQPSAQIVSNQLGHVVGFEANVKNADTFIWDFDDGTTSNLRFPRKEFPIGTYHVTLTATNTACNIVDVDSLLITVKGIEYFTPKSSGPGGDIVMQVFGGGLDTNTQVVLRQGNNTYQPTRLFARPDGSELQVVMDLHFADSGYYDVEITIPGEPTAVYPDSFLVQSLRYPYTVSEVVGPNRWRINRNTRFVMAVENTGNVMANGVIAYLVWPKSIDVTFEKEWWRPPDSGSYVIDYDDSLITHYWSFVQPFYDSTYALPTPIDSFAGEPYDGYAKIIWIPNIAANSIYNLPFFARSSSAGDVSFTTFTSKPNLFGSCGNGTYLDWIENGGYAGAEVLSTAVGNSPLDKTPVGWLTRAVAGTTKGVANLGTVMGATASYLEGNTPSITAGLPAGFDSQVSAQNAQTGSAVIGVVTDKAVDKGTANLFKGQQNNINKWVMNNPDANINSILLASESLKDINDVRQKIKDTYKTYKDLKSAKAKFDRLQKLAKDCPEIQKQLKLLENEIDKELSQREKRKKDSKTVVSMDPNAIYGPAGVGTKQFVNHTARHAFMVTFENVDTATADAQLVTIEVALDTNAFDLRTFQFSDIGFGNNYYEVPISRDEFVLDIDYRENREMDVRVQGKLDFNTGIVRWQYISIDTVTGDFPLLDGFLPPNVNAPEGEGFAMFSISPKSTIVDGYKTASQASIVFDENDPILTEYWENTIDRLPSSSMASTTVVGDTIFVDFNGSDAQSGVDFYYLYISEDDGQTWQSLDGTIKSSSKLVGESGITYSFYSKSVDRVGNAEEKTPVVEATANLTPVESDFNPSFVLFPNPNNGDLNIRSNGNFANTEINFYSITGQHVYQTKLSFVASSDAKVQLPSLASGSYLVYFETGSGKTDVQKLLIVKQE